MPGQSQQPRVAAELAREQSRLDHLYERLDAERATAAAELAEAVRRPAGTAQARLENEAAVRRLRARVGGFDAAENGLCFGRLDPVGGRARYLGRTSLRNPDPDGDEEPLLIDWRAPAARPFYTATAAAPQGVRLRRHLHARGRTLARIDDELLDAGAADPGGGELVGEAALLSALTAGRSGRMRDVVATLQAEQDRIIRSRPAGVLVVQGGPGTGKSVVALHRAAYLLYTHPRLAERGVLVVGPGPVFLGYIGQVLPGLGETNVLLATVADLFPGVAVEGAESAQAAGIKGRAVMAEVIAAAVRGRQAAVAGPVAVEAGGELLYLSVEFLQRAAEAARATGLPHNLARPHFVRPVLEHLARRLARVIADLEERIDADLADRIDTAALDAAVARDLAAALGAGASAAVPGDGEQDEIAAAEDHWRHTLPRLPQVRRLLDGLWPALTPQRLLDDLLADPARLEAAAPALTGAERAALHRPARSAFTAADVPLLDEAAELLGHDERAEHIRQARERAERVAYAQGVLDIARGSRAGEDDDEDAAGRLGAADLVDAHLLADRYEQWDARTVAERAAAERTWVFGHVIVDEAQELSAMAWRLLVRRCPTRSFTIVGDVAQSGAPDGARSWEEALEPSFGSRWRLEQLSVNYRTPEEIVTAGGPVLAAIGPALAPPRAVRRSGRPPRRLHVPAHQLPACVAQLAEAALGQVAVIAPENLLPALAAALPAASHGPRVDLLRRVVLLSARQSKGLEFDTVLLLDPQGLLSASPRGLSDLYVALTRAASTLTVLHPDPAPPALLAHLPAAT